VTAELLATLKIWNNPAFLRFWRSRLRLRKAIFWYLLVLIITTFMVSITYIARTNFGVPAEAVARGLWLPLLIIQGLIMMIKGTGSASATLIQDKIDETLDYQRLTPVTPLRNLVGYLFGLPVLEYMMFALTLPHLAFIAIVGRIPVTDLLAVYAAFFVCVILYHTTAIAVGMVMRRWFLGYIVGIVMVLIVNVILPVFISQLGLKFFQYLSVWPVISDHVVPLTLGGAVFQRAATANPFFSLANDVPFYVWSLPPLAFTLLLQSVLVITFGTMALRRWKSSTRCSLSKPYALGFLMAFIVVLLGNVWPIITRQSMPFSLFGERNLERLGEVITVALPQVYALVTWVLCYVLFAIVVPSRHSYVRGIRRALKHGRSAARPWDDDADGLIFIGLVAAIVLAGYGVLFLELSTSGFFDDFTNGVTGLWRLPLALTLVVVYTGLVMQVFGLKPTALVILLVGILPILIAVVMSAAAQNVGYLQAIIASLSPLALVVGSATISPVTAMVPGAIDRELAVAMTGANMGLVFIVLQVAYLLVRWHKQKRSDYAACQAFALENNAALLAPQTQIQ
jgi:hypothetical protein